MLFGAGVSCHILYSIVSYLYVSCSGSITLLTCDYVVSVMRGFLFLLVLGMGYVILMWHSLGLPSNIGNKVLCAVMILNLGRF